MTSARDCPKRAHHARRPASVGVLWAVLALVALLAASCQNNDACPGSASDERTSEESVPSQEVYPAESSDGGEHTSNGSVRTSGGDDAGEHPPHGDTLGCFPQEPAIREGMLEVDLSTWANGFDDLLVGTVSEVWLDEHNFVENFRNEAGRGDRRLVEDGTCVNPVWPGLVIDFAHSTWASGRDGAPSRLRVGVVDFWRARHDHIAESLQVGDTVAVAMTRFEGDYWAHVLPTVAFPILVLRTGEPGFTLYAHGGFVRDPGYCIKFDLPVHELLDLPDADALRDAWIDAQQGNHDSDKAFIIRRFVELVAFDRDGEREYIHEYGQCRASSDGSADLCAEMPTECDWESMEDEHCARFQRCICMADRDCEVWFGAGTRVCIEERCELAE